MKYYFYSAALIAIAIFVVAFIPYIVDFSEQTLISWEVPANSSQVAGVQKINVPPSSQNIEAPDLTAKAILIKDLATGTILYQKNTNDPLPIASTTKVMTALIASEYYKANSVLTIGDSASTPGSRVGFTKGEQLSFRSVLYGMLLNSGNDAANALAENYQGGVTSFIVAMNKKVSDLGLVHTHFDNPVGFDSPNSYSSAEDLAKITEEALKNAQLSRIFSTKETDIVSLDKRFSYKLHNLNKLLSSVSGVLGVKTGYTEAAKENLVTLVERNGHRILVVVLGSDDRFGESTRLIEWAYKNFSWLDI